MLNTGQVLTLYVVWFVCAYTLVYILIKKNS